MARSRSRVQFGELRRLNLARFPKAGLLPVARWNGSVDWADGATCHIDKSQAAELALTYSAGGQEFAWFVGLTAAPRHFGGAEFYFRCPWCARRCRVLHFVGAVLRCRRCIRALYHCQSVDAAGRALHRFRKLRTRIRPGTEDAGLFYFPRRPKGMRRVTYARIKADAMAALDRYHRALDAGLYRLLARIAPDELAELLG